MTETKARAELDSIRAILNMVDETEGVSWPSACLEEDGQIAFDWDLTHNIVFSFNVYPDGNVGYSGLVRGLSGSGRFYPSEGWPELWDEFVAVYRAEVR